MLQNVSSEDIEPDELATQNALNSCIMHVLKAHVHLPGGYYYRNTLRIWTSLPHFFFQIRCLDFNVNRHRPFT